MLDIYFHMNACTCDVWVFEASLKIYGFKTLKCLPLTMGYLFLNPVPDNKNTWQDVVFRAQATVMDNWPVAWSWRTATSHLSAARDTGIPRQYPCTFSKTTWDKARQISLCILSLKTLHIFLRLWEHPSNGETFQCSLSIIFSLYQKTCCKQYSQFMKMQTEISGHAELQVCKPRVTAAQSVMLL